jgi:hypothetical protein
MAAILLNERGNPEPSPEIQRRLRGIHPRLSLKYVVVAPSHWAVTLGWEDNDPRNERVRTSQLDIGFAYDIIGYLPMDASVDDAPGYLGRMFRTYPSENVQSIADHIENFNATEPLQAAIESAATEVLDSANPAGTPKARRRK